MFLTQRRNLIQWKFKWKTFNVSRRSESASFGVNVQEATTELPKCKYLSSTAVQLIIKTYVTLILGPSLIFINSSARHWVENLNRRSSGRPFSPRKQRRQFALASVFILILCTQHSKLHLKTWVRWPWLKVRSARFWQRCCCHRSVLLHSGCSSAQQWTPWKIYFVTPIQSGLI